jgi:hypothetical protein
MLGKPRGIEPEVNKPSLNIRRRTTQNYTGSFVKLKEKLNLELKKSGIRPLPFQLAKPSLYSRSC